MKALDQLKDLWLDDSIRKHPSIPRTPSYHAMPKFEDRSANGLTRCILTFLRLKANRAERISNTGRVVDTRKRFIDSVGFNRTAGSLTWIPGTGTAGTADISAIIAGRSVKIEVKVCKDRQSEAQKRYQLEVEKAGGIYFIARDFHGFLEWYKLFTNQT